MPSSARPFSQLAAAPLFVGSFTTTLLNYIGIYSLVDPRPRPAHGHRRVDLVRPGVVCRRRRLRDGLADAPREGVSPWLGLLFALSLTAAIATFLGAVTLRLSGHFLPLSTIAWGLAIFFTFGNIDALGRYNGITGIPPIFVGPISLAPSEAIFYLIWGSAGRGRLADRPICWIRAKAAPSAACAAAPS